MTRRAVRARALFSELARPAALRALLVVALATAVSACSSDDGPPSADAGLEGGPVADGSDGDGDAPASVVTVDFTVSGCPDFDTATPQCRGPAPLTVTFVPVTSGDVNRFFWDFGDLAKSSEALPTHTYVLPGSYDVSLIGAPGLVSQRRSQFIVVAANQLGDPCDVGGQCAGDLTCLCGLDAKCPRALPRGVCARACATQACPADAVCADLSLGADPANPEVWRSLQCLRSCKTDGDCPAGRLCRTVPVAGTPETWQGACFYAFPGELGDACRGPTGDPQKDTCLSGLCADLGALGFCSVDCTSAPCPTGTACAGFNDGRHLCVKPCTSTSDCRDDPLLACESAGVAGPLGFTVAGGVASALYCAPKSCDSDVLCEPAGICLGTTGASHCTRRGATSP